MVFTNSFLFACALVTTATLYIVGEYLVGGKVKVCNLPECYIRVPVSFISTSHLVYSHPITFTCISLSLHCLSARTAVITRKQTIKADNNNNRVRNEQQVVLKGVLYKV